MQTLLIDGPQKLNGVIQINGAKNGVLPLMICSLLTKSCLNLSNVPILDDVHNMIELLQNYGAKVNFDLQHKKLIIDCNNLSNFYAPSDITTKIRASIWSLAPILSRFGQIKIAFPGGCAIGDGKSGKRQIDMHLSVLEKMGAMINVDNNYICASLSGRFRPIDFCFDKISVGATINAILACVTADGLSRISNCAIEPEISDLCKCLTKMGAKIQGIGTRTLIITGVRELDGSNEQIIPDRIEAGTYLIMAAITKGSVKVQGINKSSLTALCDKLENSGNILQYFDDAITLTSGNKILPVNIDTAAFPGFVTDLQAQFMSLMCLSEGVSLISENIYANRFMHVYELNKMGANISINNNVAKIIGVKKLTSAKVTASDLRASVCLVLAGLAGFGTTEIINPHHLDRGYENLAGKLAQCGIKIQYHSTNHTNNYKTQQI